MKLEEVYKIIKEEYTIDCSNSLRFFIKFKEGKIPHIHFESKDGKRKGAIKLNISEYYPHGNPLKYTSILSKNELIKFNKKMKESKNPNNKEWTVWHQLAKDWNDNCIDGIKIDLNNIPDYRVIRYPN